MDEWLKQPKTTYNWKVSNLFNGIMIVFMVFMAIGHHMDWFLQAYQHSWGCYVDLHGRAEHLVWWLDWWPKDNWHFVQSVRNLTWFVGPIVGLFGMFTAYNSGWGMRVNIWIAPNSSHSQNKAWWYFIVWMVWNSSILWLINLAMRAIAFSLPENLYRAGVLQ